MWRLSSVAKRYDIISNVIDAVSSLGQGDILSFMGEILDIVRRKVPALATVSLTLDGIDLGGKAAKVWRSISKLEQFGSGVTEKVLNTIKNHIDDILENVAWKKNIGIELNGVLSPEGFFDDLQDELADLFNDIEILTPSQLAQYEIDGFKVNNGVIRVSIKTGGSTIPDPNGYTLEMKFGNKLPLKFRFL